jgi:hypothetical protein
VSWSPTQFYQRKVGFPYQFLNYLVTISWRKYWQRLTA